MTTEVLHTDLAPALKEAISKIEQQKAEIEQLRAALKKLGRHPEGDMEGVGRCAGFLRAAPFRDDLCDCGLNAALAGESR